jgi:hypothetical protein
MQNLLPADLVSLSQAARTIPSRRKPGTTIHPATLFRWVQEGKLQAYDCNGLRVSLAEVKARFAARPVRWRGHARGWQPVA